MKCICGYEHKSGINEQGDWKNSLIGDESFEIIIGTTFKVYEGMGKEKEIRLCICPKCGTVKIADAYY